MWIGVLALQGGVREHVRMLRDLGTDVVEVRTPDGLRGLDGLVIPGGESTTMSRLIHNSGLDGALDQAGRLGLPMLGTCAGLNLLARDAVDKAPGQYFLGLIEMVVRRDGYGTQGMSFEAEVTFRDGKTFPGVFIRAPRVLDLGPEVEVLAKTAEPAEPGDPVLVRQGNVMAAAFHPELTDDPQVHELFLDLVKSAD